MEGIWWFFVLCATGRIVIFLVQKAYPSYKIFYTKFLSDLIGCDLCLGVWVFSILAFIMKVNLFGMPIVGEILTGMVTSFIVHVWCHGWKSQYQVISIE